MADQMDTMIDHISDLLASGRVKDVKSIINEESFVCFLNEKGSDVIHIASYYLNDESIQKTPAVTRCCEKLLVKCAENGNPKECLMEFLVQIENLDGIKLNALLRPIQIVLLRISGRKDRLIQSVFHVIYRFINSLPVPQYHHKDSNSRILLDCDENTTRITDFYCIIVKFYESIVNELCGPTVINSILIQALLQLLGNPIIFLDLEVRVNGCSPIRHTVSRIMELILKLKVDPIDLLVLVEDKLLITVDEEKVLVSESSSDFKLTDLSLAIFFYLVFNEKMVDSIPCVYNKLFIYHNCLGLASTLLQHKETMVLKKGLLLIKVALNQVESGSVDCAFLAGDLHRTVFNLLSNIAVFHDIEENRKIAVELMKKHFSTFEPKAQFSVLLNMNITLLHRNIVGFFMTLLTNLVRDIFVDGRLREYFTGKRLFDLLIKYCTIENGAETDLVENKDQILSALNLIIFLTKRDRDNYSGVWNYIDCLFENLLKPLREGINLSRAHYQMQLKGLENPLKTEDGSDFTVSLGGQEINKMSKMDKKTVMNMGLTVFDLIEHLLIRAIECVEDKPRVCRGQTKSV